MKKTGIAALLAAILMLLCAAGACAQDTLVLPGDLKIIEAQAFAKTAATRVVLPEGVLEIGSGAFEESAVTSINLPESLTFIAEDAFSHTPDGLQAIAVEGSYA